MGNPKKYQSIVLSNSAEQPDVYGGFYSRLDLEPLQFSSVDSAINHFKLHSGRLLLLHGSIPVERLRRFIEMIRAAEGGAYVTIVLIAESIPARDLKSLIQAGVDLFWNGDEQSEQFRLWLSTIEKRVLDGREREENDRKIAYYKAEQEDFNAQLEDAISRANQMTQEAEQSFIEINQIFKTIAGGIIVVDTECKLLRCNDTFLAMVGRSREEAMQAKCHEIFLGELCNTPKCPLQAVKKGKKRVENDIEYTQIDGSTVYYHIISTPFRGPVGELIGIVEHITDITDRVRAEQALKESELRYKALSTVDELTRLFNKRYFSQHFRLEVERAQRYGHPLSLLLMDIDNFKHHNDTYGHADGDIVLSQLGRVVANAIRASDFGCRYGGEEFTIILPETTGENAIVVAERIRENFAALAFTPNPHEIVHKTLSVGVAQLRPEDDEKSLLERTDQNMYKAKNSGKNKYVYE